MRFQEIVEAGLIGKLGSAVGKVAKGVGAVAGGAVSAGQKFAQGAERWKGTGLLGGPRDSGSPAPAQQAQDQTPPALKEIDPEELKQILAAAVQGKQLDGRLLQTAQNIEKKL